jgi:hypothetical protein
MKCHPPVFCKRARKLLKRNSGDDFCVTKSVQAAENKPEGRKSKPEMGVLDSGWQEVGRHPPGDADRCEKKGVGGRGICKVMKTNGESGVWVDRKAGTRGCSRRSVRDVEEAFCKSAQTTDCREVAGDSGERSLPSTPLRIKKTAEVVERHELSEGLKVEFGRTRS